MSCTVDASVFVASARVSEPHHAPSRKLLGQLIDRQAPVFCPTLLLAECAAAMARATDNVLLAEETTVFVECFPRMVLTPLDAVLARRAAEIAITHRLRGADAVYVSVAEKYGVCLVTWDRELLQRTPPPVQVVTPSQWLEENK